MCKSKPTFNGKFRHDRNSEEHVEKYTHISSLPPLEQQPFATMNPDLLHLVRTRNRTPQPLVRTLALKMIRQRIAGIALQQLLHNLVRVLARAGRCP